MLDHRVVSVYTTSHSHTLSPVAHYFPFRLDSKSSLRIWTDTSSLSMSMALQNVTTLGVFLVRECRGEVGVALVIFI